MGINRGYWKDWLPPMIRQWAGQYARIRNAGRKVTAVSGKEEWHFDGWPVHTLLSRMTFEERAPGQTSERRFPEVYQGDALIVWRAMEDLRYEPRQILYVRYLCSGGYKEHCVVLGLPKTRYWDLHDEAHVYIAARVPLVEGKPPKIGPDNFGPAISGMQMN